MSDLRSNQPHATTGSTGSLDYRNEFYYMDMMQNLDAPKFIPAGSTVENIVRGNSAAGRYAVGGIIFRN